MISSAIFAKLGVGLAGCAATLYYAGGYPYGISGYNCGQELLSPPSAPRADLAASEQAEPKLSKVDASCKNL
jgi:hypothetical protein